MAKDEISKELKVEAREAFNNHKDTYTIILTGNTYPIKDKLQSWAFCWKAKNRTWVSEYAGAWEKFLFGRYIVDGAWPGVKMTCVLHKKF